MTDDVTAQPTGLSPELRALHVTHAQYHEFKKLAQLQGIIPDNELIDRVTGLVAVLMLDGRGSADLSTSLIRSGLQNIELILNEPRGLSAIDAPCAEVSSNNG